MTITDRLSPLYSTCASSNNTQLQLLYEDNRVGFLHSKLSMASQTKATLWRSKQFQQQPQTAALAVATFTHQVCILAMPSILSIVSQSIVTMETMPAAATVSCNCSFLIHISSITSCQAQHTQRAVSDQGRTLALESLQRTLSIWRSCMSCQNCVYVISRSRSTRQMVAGRLLLPLAGMLLGSGTCDLLVSTLIPGLVAVSATHLSC